MKPAERNAMLELIHVCELALAELERHDVELPDFGEPDPLRVKMRAAIKRAKAKVGVGS